MGKVTLEEVGSLEDPLTSSLYELAFTRVPQDVKAPKWKGSPDGLLRIACQTCSLPGKTIEPVPLALHSHNLNFAGKITFSGDMSVTFVENRYMSIYNYLYDWMSYIKNFKNQLGQYKTNYNSRAMLRVFDQNETVVGAFDIHGLWISGLPDINFDSENSIITIPATFKYDYAIRVAYDESPEHIDYAVATGGATSDVGGLDANGVAL